MEVISRQQAKHAGLIRYFTGQPCKHGHAAERFVSNGACHECVKKRAPARVKAWRAKQDPVALRAKRTAEAKRFRERNPELAKARASAAAKKRDKAKLAAATLSWRQRNKAHVAAYETRYNAANPDAFRAKCQRRQRNRKAREAGAIGTFTKADIHSLLLTQRGLCNGCGTCIVKAFEIDHVLALSRGGSNEPNNLQLLCKACNTSKGTKTMAEWYASHVAQLRSMPLPLAA